MQYTIGEMAKMLNVAPSALRYYEKEGLLPFVERTSGGTRVFQEKDYEWLLIIHCLKKTGMQIKDIKSFIDLTSRGDETIKERLELFLKQRRKVEAQIAELQETLKTLDYKCWFYETARNAGSLSALQNLRAEDVPASCREAFRKFSQLPGISEDS